MLPRSVEKFIEVFSKLPSLGPRLATRLAFYLLGGDRTTLKGLSEALQDIQSLDRCPQCFFIKENSRDLCPVCSDKERNNGVVAIVEKETDLIALEKTGRFRGNYLILGDLPERGVLESGQKLRLQSLKERVKKDHDGKIKEIVVAVSPNSFGDFMVESIRQEFKDLTEKVTRLGRGIPTGGEIEFADEETLGQALERRV
jgi:recombination protein RecR